jgi:4-azaleucine resistance transporter AzlC
VTRGLTTTATSAASHHSEDAAAHVALHGTREQRFWRGWRLGFPIFLGYVPLGIAFGILAHTLGFSVFASVACSATALTGAGQFIALSLLAAGAGAPNVLLSTAVVNLRYVLFASTLSPYLHGVPAPTQAVVACTLTDGTLAINIADHRQGLSTAASMAGVGAVAWTGWVFGTLVGALGAGWIGDRARFGVGFAMPAMFVGLFFALPEDWRHILIGVLGGVVVLLLPLTTSLGLKLDASWYLIIASMTATTVGVVIWREPTDS